MGRNGSITWPVAQDDVVVDFHVHYEQEMPYTLYFSIDRF